MIPLSEVTHWAMWRAMRGRPIGHVLLSIESGWYYTACKSWGPSFDLQTERPERICPKCKKALKDGSVVRLERKDG
jgi:PHP family Zn ribbon phosphoesterase